MAEFQGDNPLNIFTRQPIKKDNLVNSVDKLRGKMMFQTLAVSAFGSPAFQVSEGSLFHVISVPLE